MMKSTAHSKEKHNITSLFFYLTFITITTLFCFHLLYNNNNAYVVEYANIARDHINPNNTTTFIQPRKDSKKACDLSEGRWISDRRDSSYTNYSCRTIPFMRNCFLHGRKDTDFLHWRWKPEQCDLPRFSPGNFLTALKGKTMAFIGDSISRNQMESLLCLLSTKETPIQTEKDKDDRCVTWEFRKHNFTLMALWSQFLVTATERLVNGSTTGGFNLHLDKIDKNWSEKLPLLDYAVFSDAPWFFRQNYLYYNDNLLGCVYCQTPDVKDLGPGLAIGMAFRAAFRTINNCANCRNITTVLRTYSPSQFENGTWDNGGSCNRTRPIGREEVDRGGPDLEYRRIQVEEIETARKETRRNGNKFEVLDVTEMMLMRPDGHPGVNWGNQWMKGYSDCIHWCLPGPIDVWNEILLELIKRQSQIELSSEETGL
ncbi:hypothetical protein ACP275_08G014700 [Erythranthe tilingii]